MNIIDLAKQAEEYANNVVQSNDNDYAWGFLRDQNFAHLVAAAARSDEREQCAKVCDDNYFAFVAADEIRARGNT